MKTLILAALISSGLSVPALADPPDRRERAASYDDSFGDRQRRRIGDRSWKHSDGRERQWSGRGNGDREWQRRAWDRHDERLRDWRRWQDRNWRDDHSRRDGRGWDRDRWDRERWSRDDRRRWQRYDHYRPDPRFGGYYADRYYRPGGYYGQRWLGRGDRIYRGYDGRYYCRRSDGTTGLILGAIAGGLLGDSILVGESRTVGAIIGGSLGALIGREIARDGVRCY